MTEPQGTEVKLPYKQKCLMAAKLRANGLTLEAIATRLGISQATARNYISIGRSMKRTGPRRKNKPHNLNERIRLTDRLTKEGYSANWIARELGVDRRSVHAYRSAAKDKALAPEPISLPDAPIPLESITDPEVLECLQDTPEGFRAFQARYWPQEPMPTHVFNIVSAAYDYGVVAWKSRVILNVPPNHAKSTTFSVRWPIWRIVRDRDWTIIVLSDTQTVADDWTREIAKEFDENEALITDFGAFHTDGPEVQWQPSQGRIRVAGSHLMREFNIRARGMKTQTYGLRAKEVVADDVVDLDMASSDAYLEDLISKFRKVILSRPYPGGIVRVIGTRARLDDLYSELRDDEDFYGNKPWQHISFPAVTDWDEKRVLWDCVQNGEEHRDNYPQCCRSFEFLMKEAYSQKGESDFSLIYQQDPHPQGEARIKRDWIFGPANSNDPDRGCLDRNRVAGEILEKPAGDFVRVISVDPADTGYWSILVGDVDKTVDTFRFMVLDLWRRNRVGTRDVLIQLADFFEKYRPSYFIPEVNMPAKWWRDTHEFDALRREYGFTVLDHRTGVNKRSGDLALATLAVDFEAGDIRIPYADESYTRNSVARPLMDEALRYPHGKTTDVLMSLWFVKFQARNLYNPGRRVQSGRKFIVPARLQGKTWVSRGTDGTRG